MNFDKSTGKVRHSVATCDLCPWQEGQPLGARIDRMHAIIDGHMASAHPFEWSRKADRLAAERDQAWADGLDERLSQVVAEYCGYIDGAETTADGSADNDLAMERTEAVLALACHLRRSSVPEKLRDAARWGIETLGYSASHTVELRLISDRRPNGVLTPPDMSDAEFYEKLEDALIKVPPIGPVRLTHFEQPGRVFTGTVTEDGEGITFTAAPESPVAGSSVHYEKVNELRGTPDDIAKMKAKLDASGGTYAEWTDDAGTLFWTGLGSGVLNVMRPGDDAVMNHADESATTEPVMVSDQESEGLPPEKLGANIVGLALEAEDVLRALNDSLVQEGKPWSRTITADDLRLLQRMSIGFARAKDAATRLTMTPRRGV